jgi:hypothetical protein
MIMTHIYNVLSYISEYQDSPIGNDNNDKSSVSIGGKDDDDTDNCQSGRTSLSNNNGTDNVTNDLYLSHVIGEPKTPQDGILPGPDQLAQHDHW